MKQKKSEDSQTKSLIRNALICIFVNRWKFCKQKTLSLQELTCFNNKINNIFSALINRIQSKCVGDIHEWINPVEAL